MDYPNSHDIAQICNRYNQHNVSYEQVNNKPNCLACFQEKIYMNPDEAYQYKLEDNIKKAKLYYINNKEIYQNTHNQILDYKTSLVQSLDKVLQIIQEQMIMIDSNQQQFLKYIEQNRQEKSIEDLEKQNQQQQLCNEQFKNQVKQLLDELQKKYLTSEQLITNFDQKQKIVNWNKVECEIIKESSRKESKQCIAFVFNKENTIVFVARGKEIIVYQFINGVIVQEQQRLTDHTYDVTCLYFVQQSNLLVSGSCDKLIIISEFDNSKNRWFATLGHRVESHVQKSKNFFLFQYEKPFLEIISLMFDKIDLTPELLLLIQILIKILNTNLFFGKKNLLYNKKKQQIIIRAQDYIT